MVRADGCLFQPSRAAHSPYWGWNASKFGLCSSRQPQPCVTRLQPLHPHVCVCRSTAVPTDRTVPHLAALLHCW